MGLIWSSLSRIGVKLGLGLKVWDLGIWGFGDLESFGGGFGRPPGAADQHVVAGLVPGD